MPGLDKRELKTYWNVLGSYGHDAVYSHPWPDYYWELIERRAKQLKGSALTARVIKGANMGMVAKTMIYVDPILHCDDSKTFMRTNPTEYIIVIGTKYGSDHSVDRAIHILRHELSHIEENPDFSKNIGASPYKIASMELDVYKVELSHTPMSHIDEVKRYRSSQFRSYLKELNTNQADRLIKKAMPIIGKVRLSEKFIQDMERYSRFQEQNKLIKQRRRKRLVTGIVSK